MSLFGNKEEKAAKKEAARAESDRLVALPVADLAVEIMPAFGPDGIQAGSGHRQGAVEVAKWLLSDFDGSVKYSQPVLGPSIEGLKALERAGLLESRNFGSGNAATYHATRLGETALAEGSVKQQLS